MDDPQNQNQGGKEVQWFQKQTVMTGEQQLNMTLAQTLTMQGPSMSALKRFCAHMSAVTAFVSPQTQTSPIKQQNTIFDQSTPPRTKTFVDSATSPFEKSSSRSVNNVILPLTKEQSLF